MKTTNKHRLFKRTDDGREMSKDAPGYKERPYYFRFQYRGQRYTRSLETTDSIEAQKRAKAKYVEIVAAISAGAYNRLDATKLRLAHSPSVVELIAAYRKGPSEANARTRETNIHALLFIVPETGTLRDISPSAVRAFFETVTAKALAEPDQQKAASLRRSANSAWAKARSLFTPKCLEYYRSLDLYDDDLQAFLRAGELAKFSQRSLPKVAYNPPSDEIIVKTLAAWEKLADTDRNLFLAIGHELAFGLRIGEIAQARWNWHQIRAGYPVLDGAANVKNGSGFLQVRALDPWYTTLRCKIDKNKWAEDPDAYIITGSDAYRTDGLFRAVSDWLRQLGWGTRKTNHALRAYAGSQVAMKYGIYEAQMFLRHSTVKVTEQSYSHFVQKFKPADIESVPARWAIIVQAQAPAKVASANPDAILDAVEKFRQTPLDSATVIPWIANTRN